MTLATLLFSLRVSNGKLERTFSQLNNIKSKKQSSLATETLSDLLRVTTDSTSFQNLSPDSVVGSKTKAPTLHARKQYKLRSSGQAESDSSTSATSEDDETVLLDDWDQWMNDN